jgi:hypothetical protein
MVRRELVRAFDDACFAVVQEEMDELERTIMRLANEQSARGMSSNLLFNIDGAAAKTTYRTIERFYKHLLELLGAEVPDGSPERAEELAALLVEKTDSAGRQLRAQRDTALGSFPMGLRRIDWIDQYTQMPKALDNARMMFAARLRTAALGSVIRGGYSVSNTVNVNGGTVGAVQTGAASTAHVKQTINAVPPQADILAALQSIRDAIVAAQAGDATKHADELGTVEALTVEARKDKANRITVPALINGLGGTARLLAYAPKAFETLTTWGHALGGALPI